MDRSWYENKGSDCAAMEERYYDHVDLDQDTSLSEVDVDGTLLMMELLEDLPPSDLADGDDVDRLSHVIRSLETEIGGGGAAEAVMVVDDGTTAGPSSEDDGSRLVVDEDMLLDLGGYESGSFGYWPTEVPMVVGHAAEGWYLYAGDESEGSMIGFEAMDQQYHYVESSAAEQVYSPLWG
ncbi:hypothetical protein PR202_gb06719 [Eleusine coracana subsp. coracana]|uniref:Uncharacterized protein n=1 Tax=Eleusine coracana subsp. coracana TaxID=191504 RepID=A0AAV5EB75_ELECO|nr:hypothetical protein QOZ80_2BG0161270 [Eleusine coracana subsp. coracana]GJN19441.1 hypothetical protein PR202_gb06719 [Eleusine coracana subsp. coracana]